MFQFHQLYFLLGRLLVESFSQWSFGCHCASSSSSSSSSAETQDGHGDADSSRGKGRGELSLSASWTQDTLFGSGYFSWPWDIFPGLWILFLDSSGWGVSTPSCVKKIGNKMGYDLKALVGLSFIWLSFPWVNSIIYAKLEFGVQLTSARMVCKGQAVFYFGSSCCVNIRGMINLLTVFKGLWSNSCCGSIGAGPTVIVNFVSLAMS